ncbi:unnamed protein product [Phytophthora fragariaefolia]|uniref:Unnamed protein product n=1 Tax=Phytophthora fragariaefolia TaxID=1490495 RepID=A0A9W6Y6M6_9STRA|nr:unnamed protein product [Phytophthora fragariaefolia]
METSSREQADQVETLKLQTSAFTSRFVGLVKQYAAFLRPAAAADRSLQDHLNQFDAEIQNGDVLRLLQLFPALLEAYILTCSSGVDQDLVTKRSGTTIPNQKKPRRSLGWSRQSQLVDMDTPTWLAPPPSKSSPSSPPPEAPAPPFTAAIEKEEAQLAEQLELIRGAFQSYKDGVETHR